jgi:thiol-disulfide isomerase/thioredoxin
MVLATGADLFEFCVGVAAMFFVAGIASGRERFGARVAVVVVAGCAPIAVLAATRIAFASLPWLTAYVVTATVFATVGAAVRVLSRPRAIAVTAIAWFALFDGGRAAAGWLVAGSSFQHVDEPARDIVVSAVDGGLLRSTDHDVIVVAWWASWCAPCRAELPELEHVAEHYRGDRRVAVWWVDIDGESIEVAREHVRTRSSTMTLAFDSERVARAFGISGLPALVVVDRGRVRLRHTGYDRSERLATSLEREIDRLIDRAD